MLGKYLVAKVAVSYTAYSFDTEYSYAVPSTFSSAAKPGCRVIVPFGKGNRRRIGFITRIYERDSYNPDLKLMHSVIDSEPLISEEMLKIIFWLHENTFCTLFEAYKCVVPTGFSYNIVKKYRLVNAQIDVTLTGDEQNLVNALLSAKTEKEFDKILSQQTESRSKQKIIDSLLDKGVLEEVDSVKRRVGDETVKMVKFTPEYLSGEICVDLTPKQNLVVNLLQECESASVKEICYLVNVTPTIIKRLTEKRVLTQYDYEVLRPVKSANVVKRSLDDIVLSRSQKNVYNGIRDIIDSNKPSGALLYGVTGSGKTSVFLKLIEHTIKAGKTAIMLVPEISLTPQMVGQFKSCFGDIVAVIHSSLSLGQRVDEFKRIKSGSSKIVIGTRSAVFAPLKNIGLIIMDEEGEQTYKSDSTPRYHARDIAIQRCGYNNSTLVMASATPSLESYYFAKIGRYHLFELDERYSNAELPKVVIVDMQAEEQDGNESLFSRELIRGIEERLERNEQSILLLNRRGFNTTATCLDCKKPIECPNCNIPLTYHKKNNRLMCHYCGYSMGYNNECPDCHGNHLKMSGVGTQRVENEVQRLFPDARVLRMDADTTYSRFAYENNFKAFGEGKYDIMLGTQMIAKGLDFPNVTLVGVLSLDKALFAGNFNSYERTFSLLTQVVGRSGRGKKQGVAFIQTFVPEHYVLELASQQNYKEFYAQEIALRKALVYPPFCDICVVGINSPIDVQAQKASNTFIDILKKNINMLSYKFPLRVLGPSQFTVGKINNRYRYRIIIKCKNEKHFRELMSISLKEAMKHRSFSNVRIYADINGDIGF